MNRGDIYDATLPGGPHPAVIVTRDRAIPLLRNVCVVAVTSRVRDLPTEVPLDTRNGLARGQVRRIDPAVQNGTVTVDVSLEGELPRGARPDLSVDGTIQVERLDNVLHVGRPAYGQANSAVGLFKLVGDGTEAVRVNVRLGRTSVNTVEILGGLQVGEKVIISDMSRWDSYERVRVE